MLFSRQRKLLLPDQSIPNLLPKKLRRSDVSDYLLSQTFRKKFGEEFSRREALLKLSAAAALIALPIRPARALDWEGVLSICKGTIECGLAGLELLDEYFKVSKHTSGQADAENQESQSQDGTMILAIFDEDDELELSEGRRFSIPRHTSARFVFNHGPAPQEAGSKTFAVASEVSADTVEFEVS
jgi:hypothetical protein